MPDYYRILEIDKNATQQEIKAAYKRLALTYHPDKLSGNLVKFNLLQEAYDALRDPDKRQAYNTITLSLKNYMGYYKKNGLNFGLAPDPNRYTHYEYINGLLKLLPQEQLKNGQDIKNKDHFWFKLSYIGHRIYNRQRYLKENDSKSEGDVKKELRILALNSRKIGLIQSILLSSKKRKDLYDLSLGIAHSEELKQVALQIGGRERLIAHIRKNPKIDSAYGVFALSAANCLNPVNFNKLEECKEHCSISMVLDDLANASLLNQANFDFLLRHKKYAVSICDGMARIGSPRMVLSQANFEVVVRAGKHAKSVGSALGEFHSLGLLNEENWKTVVYKIPDKNIWNPLWEMHQQGLITPIQSDAVLWVGPSDLLPLTYSIDKMIAHSLFLLSRDIKKGKEAFLLGLELKQDLKAFFEKGIDEQEREKEPFKKAFLQKLHSKDEAMSCHRAEWKIVVANIAIALTGLGLFAIGVNYLVNGHCFFSQTKREKLVEAIEHSPWLEPAFGS